MTRETTLRVRYRETDAQGLVNSADYFSYFEVGRVEWLRATGLSYKELEERGYGFVVVEARAFYEKPAFFDDELTLRTELTELGRASLRFEYTVLRDGEMLATGYTRHGCVELASGQAEPHPRRGISLRLREPGIALRVFACGAGGALRTFQALSRRASPLEAPRSHASDLLFRGPDRNVTRTRYSAPLFV